MSLIGRVVNRDVGSLAPMPGVFPLSSVRLGRGAATVQICHTRRECAAVPAVFGMHHDYGTSDV
jgi:hypothetical protein